MRRILAGAAGAALLGLAPARAQGAAGGPADGDGLRRAEAEAAAAALGAENRRLRAEAARLSNEVAALTRALAEGTAALDGERARADRAALPPAPVISAREAVATEAAVADVNRAQGLVALDAGAEAGLRPGLRLAVLRRDRVVGRVRVVEVRERLAGAAVEETAAGQYPEPGDRAVVAR